ncbi:hypothetical protein LTR56_003717 [Elasticomyces elasticus]|nr:hypothetical protein LTR22_014645 [Elasticomyces elasticus]KAK3654859.1 hypothetical protein LTR56_003717 [Elasticomyces elasticus]KAK4928812.1 hypothetical protein LTR49_004621 [Elasticomyces elasticus]KAK5766562.1 hypothetical protein LTS12_003181 [Elasticomyces elasticus]
MADMLKTHSEPNPPILRKHQRKAKALSNATAATVVAIIILTIASTYCYWAGHAADKRMEAPIVEWDESTTEPGPTVWNVTASDRPFLIG